MKIFITNSFEETQRLGEELAESISGQGRALSKSTTIALYGDLGSGKTTFVQGLGKGLGIKRRIVSPTFIIVRSYKINIKYQISKIKSTRFAARRANKKLKTFYHIDLYRLSSDSDIMGLGLEEIIRDPQNIVAIEWAEKMGKLLPKDRIDIRFAYLSERKRRITVRNLKSQIAKLKTTT